MISDYQKETEFLRQCIRYDDTVDRHNLEERITQVQRDERCVRRAVWLMALLAALAMAGLCYAAVFMADYPLNLSQFTTTLITKVLCALGVGSLICLLAFTGLGVVYRKELDQRREECRRLATNLLESRLGKPCTMPLPGVVKDRENVVNGSESVASAAETVKLPKPLSEPAVFRTADHSRTMAAGR